MMVEPASNPDKFAWKPGDWNILTIYFVRKEGANWIWTRKPSREPEADGMSSLSDELHLIEDSFLGIPVENLKEGAYDQDGNYIEADDAILFA